MRIIFGLIFPILFCHGQDERFFREFLFPPQKKEIDQNIHYTWQIEGKVFRYDLDGDGSLEQLQMVKKDQEDWFYLSRESGDTLVRLKLQAEGRGSHIYRIRINNLATDLKVMMLYYYEGFSEFKEFYGTGRVYFLTFNPSQIKGKAKDSFRLTKGASIWQERRSRVGYYQVEYQLKVDDLNGDGFKEVVVHRGHIQRIFEYSKGRGMVSMGIY